MNNTMQTSHKIGVMLLIVALITISITADVINKNAKIKSFEDSTSDSDGNYEFAFDTSNGIIVQTAGNAAGTSGVIRYISPEGSPITLTYTADEQGFHPNGDHLPTPPPIPEEILRSLEYISTHTSSDNNDNKEDT